MTPDLTLGDTAAIIDACRAQGLLRNQAAYVLSTAYWETARTMWPVEEAYYLGAKADAYRRKLRYYPYHGRGYCQLTWQANYLKAGKVVGLDLVTHPEGALDPEVAAKIIVEGMVEGWFTGKKLSDYITLQKSDFVSARRIINGTDKAAEIAAIAMAYDRVLKAAGYGEEAPPSPAAWAAWHEANLAPALNAIVAEGTGQPAPAACPSCGRPL